MNKQTITQFIKQVLKKNIQTRKELENLKKIYAQKNKMAGSVSNSEILKAYRDLLREGKIKKDKTLLWLLQTQKIRTLSGIAVIAVLTKPYSCPGKCIYCPDQKGMPKSYLNDEPAVMRAILCQFNPYKQVRARIKMLENTGHPTDKIELIVMGGCFTSLPKRYQKWFIKRCFEAANEKKGKTLKEVQKINEKSKHRIIGITLETRPDHITPEIIKWFRELGATRVEIGVQSLYDEILKINQRGHGIEAVIKATRLLKEAGFKINYHMMPNLPGSNPKKDLAMFKKLFSSQDFQPDMLKIYPCVLTKESKLYSWWKQEKYKPYSNKQLINLLIKIKQVIPSYVRIMRLGRDIPVPDIIAGCKISNIREVVQKEMEKRGIKCQCIRCREVRDEICSPKHIALKRKEYKASDGKEIFLSYEDTKTNKLLGFLRLRIPSSSLIFPILKNSALIRELHIYGQLVPIHKKDKKAVQHLGLGKKLMLEAEKIAKKEFSLSKIAVISGVGVRDYYRRLGYRLRDTYMVKKL